MARKFAGAVASPQTLLPHPSYPFRVKIQPKPYHFRYRVEDFCFHQGYSKGYNGSGCSDSRLRSEATVPRNATSRSPILWQDASKSGASKAQSPRHM